MRISPIIAAAALTAGPAMAQDGDWSYRATLYAWLPGLNYTVGTPYGDLDSSNSDDDDGYDILANLAGAFMGTFEAQKGPWSLIGDLLYADLSQKEDTPFGLLFKNAHVEAKTTALTGYALYRVADEDRVKLDLGAGIRAFRVGLELDLKSSSRLPDYTRDQTQTWAVPLAAARVTLPFNEHWFAMGVLDGGAWQDDTTWQGLASIGYNFNQRWSAQIAYRHMALSKDFDNGKVDIDLSGPMIGASLRF